MQTLSRLILRRPLASLEAISSGLLSTTSSFLPATRVFPRCRRRRRRPPPAVALFSSSAVARSGHNRWSKIRHDKGKNDANRSKEFSNLSQEICLAVKIGGPGSDNIRLAAAITTAKKAGMQKEKIETAVKRGQGTSASGANLESIQIECIGPGSVAFIVECHTDNKLACLQDTKLILRKNHCTITPTSYLFTRKGLIRLVPGDHSYDAILESSLEVEGTEDVKEVEAEDTDARAEVEVVTDPAKTVAVADELKGRLPGIEILRNSIGWVPNDETMVSVEDPQITGELVNLIDTLEAASDVSEVYTNIK